MENAPLTPLDRGLLNLMRIRGLIAGCFILAAAFAGEIWAHTLLDLPWGPLIAAALLILLYLVLWAPPRRYRAWGYAMDPDELQVRRGVWTRVQTVVPLDRVQHIDVTRGPLEKMFGVATLVVHTAGTHNSIVTVPGLAPERAAEIRDVIREHVRSDFA